MDRRTKHLLSLGGLGAVALVLAVSPPRATPTQARMPSAAAVGPVPDAGVVHAEVTLGEDLLADSNARALRGISGAATALAVGDYDAALELSARFTRTNKKAREVDNPTWFRARALRGRALLRAGKGEDAVEQLEPLWESSSVAKRFPKDVVGFELAQARLQWAKAENTDGETAEQQREQAVKLLKKVGKLSPIRNLAQVRVAEAEALAQIRPEKSRERASAARKAAKALADIVADYPNHPRVGELWLEQAHAEARGGSVTTAADTYRAIYINRAGEPESEQAWEALNKLAASNKKVRATKLTTSEKLDRALAARHLRWVELSREILDDVVASTKSKTTRAQAQSSRAYTAYKQRDFAQCVNDLTPAYKASGNVDTRDRLLRCLERGAMYDDALKLIESRTKSKRKGTRARAYWDAVQLALRAGYYARAEKYLKKYEKLSAGNKQSRTWLSAWLPMRQGRNDEAIDAFEEAERYSGDRTRARYFRGKLMLASEDPVRSREGEALLNKVLDQDPLDYYGLQARLRLLEAGKKVPKPPELNPLPGENMPMSRRKLSARFAEADEAFGEAWPSLRRSRQLYDAGYLEESRRELRVAVQEYVTQGRKSGGVRNESFVVGLGWKSDWTYPRLRPTRDGMKTLRSKQKSEQLKSHLKTIARGLNEPYRFASLTSSAEGPRQARWHPRAFRASVEREARLYGIDPIHMWSLMYTESRFRRFVVSPVGARGALQIMPWTAQQLAERLGELGSGEAFNDDSLFDIDTNAHLAGYYVAELLKKFHGQAPMAYASYNGGPSNVQRWLEAKSKSKVPLQRDVFVEEIAFRESYRYAKRVTEVSAAYSLMYNGKLPKWRNDIDADVEDNIAF